MKTRQGLRAANLHIVKRFRFPEPIFFPNTLRRVGFFRRHVWKEQDVQSLADSERIIKLINSGTGLNLEGTTTLKRIRNPSTREEVFWAPFKPKRSSVRLVQGALPMFPFQALFNEPRVAIAREYLEQSLGTRIIDHKVDIQGRVFPAGVGTLHLSLYVEVVEGQLDPLKLLRLKESLGTVPLSVIDGAQTYSAHGVFVFLQHLMDRFVHQLVRDGGNESREVPGYYAFYNLQGENPEWKNRITDLAKLLAGKHEPEPRTLDEVSAKIRKGLATGRRENDLLAIDRQAAILFVDDGLRSKHQQSQKKRLLLEGRRCFRHRFESAIELAYIEAHLVDEYKAAFETIQSQLRAGPLSTSLRDVFTNAVTWGVLKPVAYLTFSDSVLKVHEMLRQAPQGDFWARTYLEAARDMGLPSKLDNLSAIGNEVYEQAVKYTDAHYKEVNDSLDVVRQSLIELLSVLKPT